MKRTGFVIFLILLLLTACGPREEASQTPPPTTAETPEPDPVPAPSESPVPTEPVASELPEPEQPEEREITLFLPNEMADGFVEVTARAALEPQSVVDALIAHGGLPEGVRVLDFRLEEDGHMVLDLSGEFAAALCSTGTSGEAMLTGSLVNTMLTCWDAQLLSFTVEGEIVESGHVIYDFPLTGIK